MGLHSQIMCTIKNIIIEFVSFLVDMLKMLFKSTASKDLLSMWFEDIA